MITTSAPAVAMPVITPTVSRGPMFNLVLISGEELYECAWTGGRIEVNTSVNTTSDCKSDRSINMYVWYIILPKAWPKGKHIPAQVVTCGHFYSTNYSNTIHDSLGA